ncbi:MAG: hypothetical protein PUB87_08700 [Eubacteriaceae bacterium]|nr:hypothetical protein [Eubacteriaceae bacterium]
MAPPSGIDVALKSGSGGSATAEYSADENTHTEVFPNKNHKKITV